MKNRSQNTFEITKEILSRRVPERMRLTDVVAWCMEKDMPNPANYFIGQMHDAVICKDKVYYIDTAVLIAHFTVADNDKAFKSMQCDVPTMVGLIA